MRVAKGIVTLSDLAVDGTCLSGPPNRSMYAVLNGPGISIGFIDYVENNIHILEAIAAPWRNA